MSLKELRKELKKNKAMSFENGTVIKWTASDRYTYAAIKTPVGWYTTANNNPYVPNVIHKFENLLEILKRDETSDVRIATPEAFEAVLDEGDDD